MSLSRSLSSAQCWFVMRSKILDLNEGSDKGSRGGGGDEEV